MSNLWFNIRFGIRHWQWGPNGMTFRANPYQAELRERDPNTWKWFAVHCFFGKHFS
jgi:hypothetical protein